MKSVSFALDAANKHHLDRADHLEVPIELLARVREHVVARLEHALVPRPRQDRLRRALRHRQNRVHASDRRHRILRVVRVAVGRLAGARLVPVEQTARAQEETA